MIIFKTIEQCIKTWKPQTVSILMLKRKVDKNYLTPNISIKIDQIENKNNLFQKVKTEQYFRFLSELISKNEALSINSKSICNDGR